LRTSNSKGYTKVRAKKFYLKNVTTLTENWRVLGH